MENLAELVPAVVAISSVIGAALYGGVRQVWKLYTKDKREAATTETRIKQENTLRAELAEAHEVVRQQERDYLEKQIKRLEDQMRSDNDHYQNEISAQQRAIDVLDETYQRLVQSAQADKLAMETHIEQQKVEIESLRLAYERSEKERTAMQESLKGTQTELKKAQEMISELRINKAVLEQTNALLNDQLDLLRGLVEPVRLWMQQQAA